VFAGRGLLARFLFLLPESTIGMRTGLTKPVSTQTSNWYAASVKALLNHQPGAASGVCEDPDTLTLDQEAGQVWHEFFLRTEADQRAGGRFEFHKDWAGKFPGAVARIAGVLHLADQIDLDPLGRIVGERLVVTAATMKRAIGFGEFLAEHQIAVWQMVGADPNVAGARRVLDWIQKETVAEFSARDAFNAVRGKLRTMEEVRPALSLLEAHGHIVELQGPRLARGRRPSPRYRVQPRLIPRPG
jgi:hypothetical protein